MKKIFFAALCFTILQFSNSAMALDPIKPPEMMTEQEKKDFDQTQKEWLEQNQNKRQVPQSDITNQLDSKRFRGEWSRLPPSNKREFCTNMSILCNQEANQKACDFVSKKC